MTRRDRWALAFGGAIIVAAFVCLRAAPWAVREVSARRAALVAKRELLARTRAEIREAQALGDSAPAIERRLVALAPEVLSGGGEADALTDLSGQIGAVAARERVKLVRTASVTDTTRVGRLRRVTLQASLEGDTRGGLAAVARLERGTTALSLAELRITALDPGSPRNTPEVLATEIVVRGWYVEGAPLAGGSR